MKRGVACILLSALGFSVMAAAIRLTDSLGAPVPALEKAFFRNLIAVGVAGLAFARARRTSAAAGRASGRRTDGARSGALTPAAWRDLALRSLFGAGGIFLNFYALSHIPVADAMALNKTAPFWTLLLCWALLGERMTPRQTLCVLGAFAGALLVMKPGFAGLSLATLAGLASGFCAGTAYAYLHRLGRRGVRGAPIILFFSLFSCLVFVPFLFFNCVPLNAAQFLCLCAAGAGATVGQFGITWAYRFAEPRQIAVYDYSGILFTSLFGYALFGQVPDLLSCLGFLVIIAMAFCVFKRR